MSIHDAAGQAVGEIEALQTMENPAPQVTYGGLEWSSFMQSDGKTGYWAADGSGQYYYFGPDGTLYHDAYPFMVHSGDAASNAVGNVNTYEFPAPKPTLPQPAQQYGNLDWTPFTRLDGEIGYWASDNAGAYYYFGPDGVLYHDSYPGAVQPGDFSNAVGNVATYRFA